MWGCIVVLMAVTTQTASQFLGEDEQRYSTMNREINDALLPFKDILMKATGMRKIPKDYHLRRITSEFSLDPMVPTTTHERLSYFTSLVDTFPSSPIAFHIPLESSEVLVSSRLKEGRAQFSYYREVFEMAKMIYKGYYEFIDEALVVDAFRFLYQLGIRSEALFKRMYKFSQHLDSGDLMALCGVMAEEGHVSKTLREDISNAESSKELARRFYKRAYDEGSALGHALLLTLNAKNGDAGSLEELRKLADRDNIYAKYMYNEVQAWKMTDRKSVV